MRAMSRTIRVPITAAANRQPNEESMPNSHSPAAIIHLPTGGCTARSPASR